MNVRRIELIVILSALMTACNGSSLFGNSTNDSSAQSTSDACTAASDAIIPNRFIVHWQDGHVSVENSENMELFQRHFVQANSAQIRHVEYDQYVKTMGTRVQPSTTTADMNTWGPDITQASVAWNQGANGQGILVAVVDAAVDYTHPQLAPRLAPNPPEIKGKAGVDDDGNGFIDDFYGWDFVGGGANPSALVSSTNGHATHVSGIIAADHNAGPVQGMAPQAQIIPVNFMAANETGSLGTAIQAIQYAESRGAQVINASWGGPSCSQTMKEVVSGLATKNILFVVAAGNDGNDLGSTPTYPANFNFANQLTVGSTTNSDYLDSWSNYSYTFVHLGAPGDTIYSTLPGNTTGYMSGTSMATPMVSGAAALLWSLRPTATLSQIRQALLAGVDNRGLAVQTSGRLNVANSIQSLLKMIP